MNKLRCLIVEDEPLAAEGLEAYIRDTPMLALAGTCADALAAMEFLKNQPIEVLFLDIHLPKLKGLDFLKTLTQTPQVILTTAYHQYALEGYELNVVDYLLKPFSFARFLAAVNKLRVPETMSPLVQAATTVRLFHFFNENKRQVKIFNDEILYVESLKEYVRIFLADGRAIVTKFQLGELESYLKDPNLIRIHRSYLVAKDKVTAFSVSEIEIGKVKLPIGRSYRHLLGEL